MKNAKQFFAITIILIILIGVSGCMSNKDNTQANLEKQEQMLSYLQEKYDQAFTPVEFIPAKRGFNDFMSENILVVRSSEGFLANVRDRVQSPGYFYDNFFDSYASFLAKDLVDFSNVPSLIIGKINPTIRVSSITYDELKSGVPFLTETTVINTVSFVAISGIPSDIIIDALYSVYQQLQNYKFGYFYFGIAFTKDPEKSKQYVENYNLHGTKEWDYYDKSVIKLVEIEEVGLSYDAFKQKFK